MNIQVIALALTLPIEGFWIQGTASLDMTVYLIVIEKVRQDLGAAEGEWLSLPYTLTFVYYPKRRHANRLRT